MPRERIKYSYETAWNAVEQRARESAAENLLILDADETLTNTVEYWVVTLNNLISTHLGIPLDSLPTAEAVFAAGGTDSIYKQYFPSGDVYNSVMDMLRHSWQANFLPKEMEHGIAAVLEDLAGEQEAVSVEAVAVVTARPADDTVVRATHLQLHRKYKQPSVPIIARPADVPIRETTSWKVGRLERLLEVAPGKRIVIVDDSLSLANVLRARNRQKGREHVTLQVVYPGPNTRPVIDRGDFTEEPESGIFISSWATMKQTLQRMADLWNINPLSLSLGTRT